jgi:tetratricopeptide (TPR) repeat protein
MAVGEADTTTRLRRQLGEAAIAHATRGEWEQAADANRQLLELGPDIDGYNRLGKALAELGRHAEALEAYEQALERDATNRIAQRNVERLRLLTASEKASKANGKKRQEKAPATVFIEEMGKTGRARLINLGGPRVLAPLSPGDAVELVVDGEELVARVGSSTVGTVEPRIATRLLKLMASGNRYEAAITTIHETGSDLTIIIREVFTHPANFGKVSFPMASATGGGGVRPYMKGSALRYDDDEETEEVDEDSEEVEELDTTLPEYSAEPEDEEELVEEP